MLWMTASFVFGLLLGIVISPLLRHPRPDVRFASITIAAVGVFGALLHAFLVQPDSSRHYLPSFDMITLWWVVIFLVGITLPIVSEIRFRDIGVTLAKVEKITMRTADVLQTWMFTTRDLICRLENPQVTLADASAEIQQFMQLRSYEALEFIGQDGEKRRLSVWIYNGQTDRLEFFFSNEIRDELTTSHTFRPGDGVIGTVFRNDECWNERDAPSLPVWVAIRRKRPQYRGLFCRPIRFGEFRLGVLSVDRQRAERFERDDEDVLAAFAEMLAIVLGNKRTRDIFAGSE
jgi:GAF domain